MVVQISKKREKNLHHTIQIFKFITLGSVLGMSLRCLVHGHQRIWRGSVLLLLQTNVISCFWGFPFQLVGVPGNILLRPPVATPLGDVVQTLGRGAAAKLVDFSILSLSHNVGNKEWASVTKLIVLASQTNEKRETAWKNRPPWTENLSSRAHMKPLFRCVREFYFFF